MSQRAVQAKLESQLQGDPEPPPDPTMLWDMVSYRDLEDLLVGACRNPANRIGVSHYVRWMSGLAGSWNADTTLLELMAILAMAAEPPPLWEDAMT